MQKLAILRLFLLIQDGDFLVRESQASSGQYVLTGMQNNSKKHLLLVDPQGIVSFFFLEIPRNSLLNYCEF